MKLTPVPSFIMYTFAKFLLKEFVWLLSGDWAGDWITLSVSDSCHQIRGGVSLRSVQESGRHLPEGESHTHWCIMWCHQIKCHHLRIQICINLDSTLNFREFSPMSKRKQSYWFCHWEFSRIANDQRMLQVGQWMFPCSGSGLGDTQYSAQRSRDPSLRFNSVNVVITRPAHPAFL